MGSAWLGELLGTFFLIVFGCGVVANTLLSRSKGENGGWLSIVTGWAMAVMIGVFVAQSAGSMQADINPAVTLAKYILCVYDNLPQVLCLMLSQLLGAFLGAIVVWLIYLPHWKETTDPTKKLAVFSTAPAIRQTGANFLTETLCTIILVMGIWAIFGEATMGSPVNGLGPYLVGMLVWGIGLSFGGPTGYAINPARDLGPRLAHAILPIAGKGNSDWEYAWVPVLAPFLGAMLGAIFVALVF